MSRPVFLAVMLVLCAGCGSVEDSFLYHPTHDVHSIAPTPESKVSEVALHLPDGTAIHGRWFPSEQERGALLFCHGNAGDLQGRIETVNALRDSLGVSVLIFDYPGYGKSGGEPSEAGLYASADAAYDWLAYQKNIDPEQILIFGESLGGAVAVDLASRRPHRGLVLVKTFTSIPDLAGQKVPWLPSPRLMVPSRFDSIAKIKQCRGPIFVAHDVHDEVIPFAQGERLYVEANDPKQFLSLPAGGHNDPLSPDFYRALAQFLDHGARSASLGQPMAH